MTCLYSPADHEVAGLLCFPGLGGAAVARSRHRTGHAYRVARKRMFDLYGHTCHLCGHGGAVEADHLIPISIWSTQPIDPHAMRPAHGANGKCPRCGLACNQVKGNKLVMPTLNTSRDW